MKLNSTEYFHSGPCIMQTRLCNSQLNPAWAELSEKNTSSPREGQQPLPQCDPVQRTHSPSSPLPGTVLVPHHCLLFLSKCPLTPCSRCYFRLGILYYLVLIALKQKKPQQSTKQKTTSKRNNKKT